MHVKVCGVRTSAAALACSEAGADFAGLNFVSGRRRCVTVAQAIDLKVALGDVTPVGVFLDAEPDEVMDVALAVGLDWVQLHGSEDPASFSGVSGRLNIIKALPHKGFQSRSKGWGRLAKWLLVDGVKPGSGVGWAWDELPVHATNGTPLMLAGGLGPDNVAKAIAQSQPDGVDAASGLEVGGQLDPQKIIEFVANARGASLGRVR